MERTNRAVLVLVCALLGAGMPVPADAWHGWPHYRAPAPYHYPWYAPWYAPPVVVPPPVVVAPPAAPPVVYQQQAPVPQPEPLWYYCRDPEGYYPHIPQCPHGWLKVIPDAKPPGER